MTRADVIENERHQARQYRREASRRHKNPEVAAQLIVWAEASERRVECLKFGPLFGGSE